MAVTEATFRQLSLEDPEGQWELVCGKLRQKPPMTHSHRYASFEIAVQLRQQLDPLSFQIGHDHSRTRLPGGSYYIPDVVVIPAELTMQHLGRTDALDVYDEPLPLVVEVWSPTTGDYDVEQKLEGYRERGDREIWLVHPYERTLTAWRLQPDGSYAETRHDGGTVEPVSLPGVRVDLERVFEP